MSDAAKVVELDRDRWRYKMKDLCELTGLERQTIHFYIQQGLMSPGHKTGRNMAWYGQEHLQRLETIKKLQHERFLPLKAIKALLDGQDSVFTPAQRLFLSDVRRNLADDIGRAEDRQSMVNAEAMLERTGVDREDLERALALGLVGAQTDSEGQLQIAEADVWRFELFGKVRSIGFTREHGFSVDDLMFYEELVTKLFQEEIRLVSSRLNELPPAQVATMIEKVIPIIHELITQQHEKQVREFFGTLPEGGSDAE